MSTIKVAFFAAFASTSALAVGCTSNASDREAGTNVGTTTEGLSFTVENYSVVADGAQYALIGDVERVRQTIYPSQLKVDGVMLSRAPEAKSEATISPNGSSPCLYCFCEGGRCQCIRVPCP